MKNIICKIIPLFILIMLTGCSEDNETPVIELMGVYINGAPFSDGAAGEAPLSGEIEVAFSRAIDPEAAEVAISLTGGNEASYSVNLENAGTKVVIDYQDLQPATEYTLEIQPARIGKEGESLTDLISRSFTTVEQDLPDTTPCTSGTENCLKTIEISHNDQTFTFSYFSNYDIRNSGDYQWENIEKAVVVVHGQNRDAGDYFQYMNTAVTSIDELSKTLVIAPYFKEESAAEDGELFWDDNWRFGADSGNSSGAVSSFEVMDDLLSAVFEASLPSLQKVYITGHSSGAAFAQHYALANPIENDFSEYDFTYLVANNQYFYYPGEERYDEASDSFIVPSDCSGYNYWPYGYEVAVPYVQQIDEATAKDQFLNRKIVYLLGTEDTVTTGTLNTTDCAATLLGINRYQRGLNMYDYLEEFFPTVHQHRILEVNGVGHDAQAMFGSEVFKDFLQE